MIIDAGNSIKKRGIVFHLTNFILNSLLENILFNASFFDINIRYNAVVNGVNRPASINIRNMGSLFIGSPKYGAANQNVQVTAKIKIKNCLGLYVIVSFIKLKTPKRKHAWYRVGPEDQNFY